MTEVRKPGGNSKIASVPYVFQLELSNVVINPLLIFFAYFRYPQKLQNLHGSAYSVSRKLQKIEGGGLSVK